MPSSDEDSKGRTDNAPTSPAKIALIATNEKVDNVATATSAPSTTAATPFPAFHYPPGYYPLHCGYPGYPFYYPHFPMGQDGAHPLAFRSSHLPGSLEFNYEQAYNFYYQRQHQALDGNPTSNKRSETTSSSDGSSRNSIAAARISKGRLRWTTEMDALLKEAVDIYGKSGVGMWKKVADYVNAGVNYTFLDENNKPVDFVITNHQCGERYKHHIDPALQVKKKGPWTEEEVDQLLELVEQYQSKDEGITEHGRSKAQVNWLEVSARLNRNYRDCQHKYINITKSTLRNGPFSPNEEEIIMKRVEEWGEKSHGVWTKLEKELGRRSRSIQDKYSRMAKRRKT